MRDIEAFFKQSSEWIAEKLSERQRIQNACRPRRFAPGEEFMYLGRRYPLLLAAPNEKVPYLSFSDDSFLVPSNHLHRARDLFIKWYKAKALERFQERVIELGKKLNLMPRGLRLMTARTQWGSCSPDNRLSFNWKLLMADEGCIDYVVAHELLHLRERNHSRKFWSALESFMPDYRSRKAWLDENAHLLSI